jgi:hypothetical protein
MNAECKDNESYTLKNGVYMEMFAVVNGERHTSRILNISEAADILTNGLMDGVAKLWE